MILNTLEHALGRVLSLRNGSNRAKRDLNDNSGLVLGRSQHPYDPRKWERAGLPDQERLKHVYIVGATSSGKTKLLESFIRQDISRGKGFCLLDPHGDLSRNVLKFLASKVERDPYGFLDLLNERLVLIEPFNQQGVIGFNPLEARGTPSFAVAAELVAIFKKVWEKAYWGPRMEELLRNTFITLSENGLTLLETARLLTDQHFRTRLVERLPRGEVREYWVHRYDPLTEGMKGLFREPALNRISVFTADPGIRFMIGQARSTVDFRALMDGEKWLIINLGKGHLRDNIYLLGGLLIAKLKMAAMSRVDVPEEGRVPFYLYVDEFQNFMGEDFDTILSESRKYRLSLTLAHQFLDQIDHRLRASILGNVHTKIAFRLSHHDAPQISSEMGRREQPLIEKRLINFKVGQAYLKCTGETPRVLQTLHVSDPGENREIMAMIRNLSMANFGRPRREVEREIEGRQGQRPKNEDDRARGAGRPAVARPRLGANIREGWNDW